MGIRCIAIASCPALRAPAGLKIPMTIDEILDACVTGRQSAQPARRQAFSAALDRTSCRGLKGGAR